MAEKSVSYKVINKDGKEVGNMSLNPSVFGAPVLQDLVQSAVRWQRAKSRAGTHSVLTRSNIKGGAKKPFKQKGTGRARAGSSVSPLWVGGAVVHGPTPRSYEFRFPKRVRKQALAAVLSDKVNNEAIKIVDDLAFSGKTKEFSAMLDKLELAGKKVLLVVNGKEQSEESLVRAARNLPKVEILSIAGLNVYSLMNAETVLCSKAVMEQFQTLAESK